MSVIAIKGEYSGPIEHLEPGYLRKVALIEANLLLSQGILPVEFKNVRAVIERETLFSMPAAGGAGIGEPVFRRVPLADASDALVGFIDFSVNPLLGGVLLAVGLGEGTIRSRFLRPSRGRGEGAMLTAAHLDAAGDELFVYNYPKVGMMQEGGPVDFFSGEQIEIDEGPDALRPRRVFRLKDNLTALEIERRCARFNNEAMFWQLIINELSQGVSVTGISEGFIEALLEKEEIEVDSDSVSTVDGQASVRDLVAIGQEELDWCYAACVQTVLSFYRYEYPQGVIAHVLQIADGGIVKSLEHNVVDALERMTRSGLIGRMIRSPEWRDFRDELLKRRPSIGLITGHCRVIIGASVVSARGNIRRLELFGLSLLDPYPTKRGTRICWENFDTISYLAMFGARLDVVSKSEIGLVDWLIKRTEEIVVRDASLLGISSDARGTHVERLYDAQEGIGGWLVGLETEGRISDFAIFDDNFKLRHMLQRTDGLRFFDRQLATEMIWRNARAEEGEDVKVNLPELFLDTDSSLVWQARVKRLGFEERLIKLPKIPTRSLTSNPK